MSLDSKTDKKDIILSSKKQKRASEKYNEKLSKLMKSSMFNNDDNSIVDFCNRTGISYQRARRIRGAKSKNSHVDNMSQEVLVMGGVLNIDIVDKNNKENE